MKHQNEQKKLKALVRDLERELSEGKSQVEALEETNERLQEAERICQELVDENRCLRGEIANWQERFAASEGNQKQLGILRQQLDALQAEYARVMENNREMQAKLTARTEARVISSPTENDSPSPIAPQIKANVAAPLSSELIGSGKPNGDLPIASDLAPKTDPAKETKIRQIFQTVQNWRSGATLAGATIVITLGVIITLGVLGIKILRTEDRVSNDQTSSHETAAAAQAATPVSPPAVASAPSIRGVFKTIRPAHVFSEPSENSALVAEIDKGVKLNVVGSREGWLEIRSKHGRPPGFVRQEETIRIGSN